MILTSINTLSSDSSLSEASSSSVLNILSQILTILFHHIQMSITSCIFCISFTHFFVKYLAYHESRSFETRQLTEAAVPKIRDLLAKGLSKKLLKNLLPLNQLEPNLEELVLGWSSL